MPLCTGDDLGRRATSVTGKHGCIESAKKMGLMLCLCRMRTLSDAHPRGPQPCTAGGNQAGSLSLQAPSPLLLVLILPYASRVFRRVLFDLRATSLARHIVGSCTRPPPCSLVLFCPWACCVCLGSLRRHCLPTIPWSPTRRTTSSSLEVSPKLTSSIPMLTFLCRGNCGIRSRKPLDRTRRGESSPYRGGRQVSVNGSHEVHHSSDPV